MAFASNLNKKGSEAMRRLKESLREFPATTWNDVYNRYSTKLRIEEDTIAQPRADERAGSRHSESEKMSGKNRTTDCRLLQGEVEHLLKQGYLTDLVSEKGRQSYMKNRQEPPKPPSPKRTVNVITGGDEVNGITYTVAKKMSKVMVTYGKRVRQVLDGDSKIFDAEDADGLMIPHNDALEISLLVHDTNVKRVLIDPGSSVNIILLRVVNEMQANDKVIPKARSLSGFDIQVLSQKGKLYSLRS
ncbi:uncharacterized protein [Nicotiana tomentosiformis]|uniref:uncharacterized protein n=1 Tax=Nicotiana tomentosiformis TaxID=4098 RepID=UPI00388C6EE1